MDTAVTFRNAIVATVGAGVVSRIIIARRKIYLISIFIGLLPHLQAIRTK